MLMNSEDLSKKYNITKEQADLLLMKLQQDSTEDETRTISRVTQIIMLTQKLETLGFKPSIAGCEALVSCIPSSTRDSYPESAIDAAIEYLSKL